MCAKCSLPLCGICANFTESGAYCESCASFAELEGKVASRQKTSSSGNNSEMDKMVSEEIPNAPKSSDGLARRGETPGKSEKIHMAIVIVSCIFITFQITGSLNSGKVLTSTQIVAQEEKRINLESCVQMFWEIAEVLQNDRLPNGSQTCPGTTLPNVITRDGGDVIVRHPQPQTLGYTEIVVSKSNPVPELIR